MTREEAIKMLERRRDRSAKQVRDFEELFHGKSAHRIDVECYNMAIAALKEREGKDTNVPTQWISVKDRLPDASADVSLCTRSGIVGTGYYDKYRKSWVQYYAGGALCVDVTHWMPMPEPPKGE